MLRPHSSASLSSGTGTCCSNRGVRQQPAAQCLHAERSDDKRRAKPVRFIVFMGWAALLLYWRPPAGHGPRSNINVTYPPQDSPRPPSSARSDSAGECLMPARVSRIRSTRRAEFRSMPSERSFQSRSPDQRRWTAPVMCQPSASSSGKTDANAGRMLFIDRSGKLRDECHELLVDAQSMPRKGGERLALLASKPANGIQIALLLRNAG